MTPLPSWIESLQESDPDAYESIKRYLFTSQANPQSHVTATTPAPYPPQTASHFQPYPASITTTQSPHQDTFQQQSFPQG